MSPARTPFSIAAITFLLLTLNSNAENAPGSTTGSQPPAWLKCKPGKTPTQLEKDSGRVIWKCIKSTSPTPDASAPAAAPTTNAAVAPTTPVDAPPANATTPSTATAPTTATAPATPAAPERATAVVAPTATPAPVEPVNPVVVSVPAGSSPAIPVGLKATCFDGANVFTSNGTCPVVKYKGLTTWAFSFIDNRMSFALVTYDANNNIVQNSTVDGGRYVWQITVDEGTRTATVWGQANSKASAPWARFAGEPVPANTATAPAPAPAPTPVTPVVVIPTFGQATQPTTTSTVNVLTAPVQCSIQTAQPQTGSTALSTTVNVLPSQPQSQNCPN